MKDLSIEAKKTILKALQAGQISPEDITPARFIVVTHTEGAAFAEVDGEPRSPEEVEELRQSIVKQNEVRDRFGLPLHRITFLIFDNFNKEQANDKDFNPWR